MQRLIAEVSRPIVLSDPASRKLASIRDARARLNRGGNQDPTREQLMTETGLTRQQVDGLLAAETGSRGLDEPADGDEGPTLGETIADPVAGDEYDRVDDDGEAGLVRRLAAGLGDRERTIVHSRFGIGRPEKTLREVGEVLDLSAERVRQIEERALTKLRSAFETAVA
jgi:RNA polymerase sigma factor (sigma-70 family)